MFTFDCIRTDRELDELQAFRARMFATYLPPYALAAGRDDDGVDRTSFNIVARQDERIVGCLRLTLPPADWYAPQFCDLPPLPYPADQMAEVNRFAVAPLYRDLLTTKAVRRGMVAVTMRTAIEHGIVSTISVTHQSVFRLLLRQDRASGAFEEVPATERPYEGYYVGFQANETQPIVAFTMDVARYLTFVESDAREKVHA